MCIARLQAQAKLYEFPHVELLMESPTQGVEALSNLIKGTLRPMVVSTKRLGSKWTAASPLLLVAWNKLFDELLNILGLGGDMVSN